MSAFARLSPSPEPSVSSLDSGGSAHDAAAAPEAGPSRPMLGLRDLAGMYRRERAARGGGGKAVAGDGGAGGAGATGATDDVGAAAGRVTIEVVGLPPGYDEAVVAPSRDSNVPSPGAHAREREPWDPGVTVFRSPKGAPTFARDVEIKGWKVVGGKSWTGGGKVGAYVVYDVVFSLQHVAVLRRYTDFERLRDELRRAYPTIPTLPGKNHMSKFSPAFLADRQTRLQRFVRTVALHPEMGQGGDSVLGRWVVPGASGAGT